MVRPGSKQESLRLQLHKMEDGPRSHCLTGKIKSKLLWTPLPDPQFSEALPNLQKTATLQAMCQNNTHLASPLALCAPPCNLGPTAAGRSAVEGPGPGNLLSCGVSGGSLKCIQEWSRFPSSCLHLEKHPANSHGESEVCSMTFYDGHFTFANLILVVQHKRGA